jgi:hypothetical protein
MFRLLSRIVLYPLSVRLSFVVCPQEPLLKLGVPWLKKKRLRNTGLWHQVSLLVLCAHDGETGKVTPSRAWHEYFVFLVIKSIVYKECFSAGGPQLLLKGPTSSVYSTLLLFVLMLYCCNFKPFSSYLFPSTFEFKTWKKIPSTHILISVYSI